jgi:hypothetical protein
MTLILKNAKASLQSIPKPLKLKEASTPCPVLILRDSRNPVRWDAFNACHLEPFPIVDAIVHLHRRLSINYFVIINFCFQIFRSMYNVEKMI